MICISAGPVQRNGSGRMLSSKEGAKNGGHKTCLEGALAIESILNSVACAGSGACFSNLHARVG